MFNLNTGLLRGVFAFTVFGFANCLGMLIHNGGEKAVSSIEVGRFLGSSTKDSSSAETQKTQKKCNVCCDVANTLQSWKDAFSERFSEWKALRKCFKVKEGNSSQLSDAKQDANDIYAELQDMCISVEQGRLREYTCLRDSFEKAIEVMNDIKKVLMEQK